jgi:hypothetical protein
VSHTRHSCLPYATKGTRDTGHHCIRLSFVPNLLGGLVILVVGYFVAKVLGKLVGTLLGRVGFDQWMDRAGVSGVLQRSGTGLTASAMLGKVVWAGTRSSCTPPSPR